MYERIEDSFSQRELVKVCNTGQKHLLVLGGEIKVKTDTDAEMRNHMGSDHFLYVHYIPCKKQDPIVDITSLDWFVHRFNA